MKKGLICALIAVIIVLIGVVSVIKLSNIASSPPKNSVSKETPDKTEENSDEKEIRAVWVYYRELETKDTSKKNYKKKIDDIFSKISDKGYNTAFVQVRAFADAFYKSKYYPSTQYLCEGKADFDALEIICTTAKKYDIDVHAWINPYRISYDTADESQSYPLTSAVIKTNSVLMYNPGNSEARNLVLNGVKEIIDNYGVAGIHIDDYFYPTDIENSDSADYESYTSSGGSLDLESWRRSNVNTLIKDMYNLIKSKNKSLIFSISPSADIRKNYTSYYADVYAWCGNPGYCDWIIPQIYFGFENTNMPFESTLNSWENIIQNNAVKLIPGLPAYKQGQADDFAGDGKNEFVENSDVVSRQIDEVLTRSTCSGYAIYSYSYIDKV